MTALQIVSIILGILGFGGMVSGLEIRAVGRKIDRAEARREERENARIEETVLIREGICAIGHLSEATAVAQKEGRTNGKTDTALEYYRKYRDKEDAFVRRQAAEHIHGEA